MPATEDALLRKFQFHKVRLKVNLEEKVLTHPTDFNSIRYD